MYRIKNTVLAAKRLEAGSEVEAKDIGGEDEIARLIALGAIEEIDAAPEPVPVLPEMDDDLRVAMIGAINDLPGDAFDKGGKPKVKALEAALPDHADRITAASRDLIWDEMQAAANAAS